MSILDIKNRTENWRTARFFAPFFEDHAARTLLAERLLGKSLDDDYVKLELFWYGVRDYLSAKGEPGDHEIMEAYQRCDAFRNLHSDISTFEPTGGAAKFAELKDAKNYSADNAKALTENIKNTEIDVVLETRNCLFIGEAKYESKLDGKGKHVLVHQLIRQYVTATVLVELMGRPKCVVPFVVADNVKSVRKTAQVNFMMAKGWLKENSILSWGSIESLAKTPPP